MEAEETVLERKPEVANTLYSVEFFHIYTDEKINQVHEASVYYLQEAKKAWHFTGELILLIDDYNPTEHTLEAREVLNYLRQEGVYPAFWAYEGDLIENAKLLLSRISSPKLKKSYHNYIEKHDKYPCSLLTATWYLTRLGALPYAETIRSTSDSEYKPADRLINILPQDYEKIELKAMGLIRESEFGGMEDRIQDLFFPISSGRQDSLW
jgi:hypothetical protein